ncbi:FAD-dependent oxidoreductase [Falsirhodobacter deserti]|uniref:oxidoreductase n=1 Tax=Falsirhodobacter deserti TaxID=1365611 RepID=UPI001F4DD0B5|nr:FAD-dependent oxidoreductase [Falsirhodobacter deserti]
MQMTAPPSLTADPLLQPFRLRGLTLRNRVVSTSHASMLDDGGIPLDRYQAYHEEKAKGGLALTMIGGSAMVSRDASWGAGQLNLTGDTVIPHLTRLAERVHGHGAAVMCQISHLGRRATALGSGWLPAIAPSRIRETRTRSFPREMDRADIDRVIADFAAAALRCKEAGLDGVETITGGHLMGQFLSPRTNHRTDGFGGSARNRARFVLMAHEAIRRAVGDDFVVGIRYVVDEAGEDGLHPDDCIEIAKLLEAEGHIDLFNCIYGRMDSDLLLTEHNMPGMFQKSAPFLPEVLAFRAEIGLPIMHAAGIRDVATARHVVREGVADLVGMTRAHIADPQIVNRIAAGEEERIRPCVGASYCLYRKAHCIHNPATTRETTLTHDIPRTDTPQHAVVVGGGPAGMEAARVLAERGHRVTLMEAGPRLGGQVLVAASAPGRQDLLGVTEWRAAELERLGVKILLDTYAEAQDIFAERPQIVITATGGIPDLDWLDGGEHCTSVWDILTGSVPMQDDVLIYDGTGRQAAPSAALKLAGRKVVFVTPDAVPAVEMPYQDATSFRKRLYQNGIGTLTDHTLVRVTRGGSRLTAILRNEMTGEERRIDAAQVVVEHGTLPMEELFLDLRTASVNDGITDIDRLLANAPQPPVRSNGFVLYRIGDASASRDLHASILDAYRLCRQL